VKKLICIAAVFCNMAHAEFMDGNQLLNDLRGDSHDRMFAMGYVVGIADAIRSISFCPQSNVNAGQLRDMVRNYLDNTPAVQHLTGDVIVSHVLKTTWPCAQRRGNGI
jgi:hypothetical protein